MTGGQWLCAAVIAALLTLAYVCVLCDRGEYNGEEEL